MDTFEIDLDLLQFNPYNTRIVSDTKEYAQIGGYQEFTDIDIDTQQEEIIKILWGKFKLSNKFNA